MRCREAINDQGRSALSDERVNWPLGRMLLKSSGCATTTVTLLDPAVSLFEPRAHLPSSGAPYTLPAKAVLRRWLLICFRPKLYLFSFLYGWNISCTLSSRVVGISVGTFSLISARFLRREANTPTDDLNNMAPYRCVLNAGWSWRKCRTQLSGSLYGRFLSYWC